MQELRYKITSSLFSLLADDNDAGNLNNMEFLLRNKVQKSDDTYQCLVCFTFIKRMGDMTKHMRNIHCVLDSQYFCPSCDKWFRNRKSIYDHIRKVHPDWNVSDYEKFRVESS